MVVLAGGLGAGWVGLRGAAAAEHLARAGTLLHRLHTELAAGQASAARASLDELQRHTAAAVHRTRGLPWRIGSRMPMVGDDLAAVATVAGVLDDLARQGLPPLVATAGQVTPAALAPRRGRVPVAALAGAAPALRTVDAGVRRALHRVDAIATGGLHDRIRAGVEELRAGLRRAAAMTGTAARTAGLLPAMLGAGGPRTYLMVFQNLAEVRATGGMPGAFVVVSADRGALRIVDQGSATGLRVFDRPVRRVDPAMRALYTDRLATYPADVNFTPHFPTAAALIREMYRLRSGHTVDGVLATDPVALSYLLRAVGPVRAPDGRRLTAGNAVRTLLSEVYGRTASGSAQDRYFAVAARTVFDRLTRGPVNPRAAVTQLARAAGERRVLAWSARPAEQRLIAGTVLEGALPTSDGDRPTVGVFLNDGTGAKLGYYLTRAVEVTSGPCRTDGRRELSVRVTLGSRAPRSGLSPSVLGRQLAGPYTLRTNVLVFSPAGGTVDTARLDGRRVPLAAGVERGRAVGTVTVDLRPGASRTLEMTVLTAPLPSLAGRGAPFVPRLWLTPGTGPWERFVRPAAKC